MRTRPDTLLLSAPDPAAEISADILLSPRVGVPEGAVYFPGWTPEYFPAWTPSADEGRPPPPGFREASPQVVFGVRSQLSAAVQPAPPRERADPQRTNGLLLDGLTVMLFTLYFALLFRHRPAIGVLFRALTVKGQFDQLVDEQSVAFRQFIASARIVGFIALVTALLKSCLIWNGAMPAFRIPDDHLPFLLPLLVGVLSAIGFYKWLVVRVISGLSGQRSRIGCLRAFDRICFAAIALTFTPLVLLCALADPATERALFVIGIILLTLLLLYYTVKNFSFFLSRDLPILQWFLYLCAVEIFPISFFVLFVRRGFVW